jgi:hypothetical protein
MNDQQTCGKGLAENSTLPAKLADVIESMARVLETHMEALDLTDDDSRLEHEAHRELAKELGKIAAELQATSRRMAGYRDLPMGRHDPQRMAGSNAREAFGRFVAHKEELLGLLRTRLEAEWAMLKEMRGPGG